MASVSGYSSLARPVIRLGQSTASACPAILRRAARDARGSDAASFCRLEDSRVERPRRATRLVRPLVACQYRRYRFRGGDLVREARSNQQNSEQELLCEATR